MIDERAHVMMPDISIQSIKSLALRGSQTGHDYID